MGPPPNPQELERMLDDPNFLSQMNEMMNNPAFLEMMEQSPMLRNSPEARRMFQDPAYRRLIMNPELIRAQMRMQANMGQRGGGSFPAPGVTDTTPQTGGGLQNTNTQGQNAAGTQSPFDILRGLGPPPTGAGVGAANPFAALFGPTPTAGSNPSQNTSTDANSNTASAAPTNPFGNIFGTGGPSPDLMRAMMRGTGGGALGAADGANPFADEGTNAAVMRLMNNPEFMRAMGEAMGGGAGAGGASGADPFAGLLGGFGGGGGAGGFGASPPPPVDTRPPEERYADQLRQLNDMGFYEFERNVTALRRSGGSVQGAVEYLLSSPPTGDS
jgi:ubiquilin